MKQLNNKEKKQILAQLADKFGCDTDELKQHAFFLNENKSKLYIATEQLANLELGNIKVDTIGCYFGQLMNDNDIRLSIEGSQLVGKTATKGIIELNDDEFYHWVRGEDLEKHSEETGFAIIKHNNDFIGCGKPVHEKIHNYIPKTRYVHG